MAHLLAEVVPLHRHHALLERCPFGVKVVRSAGVKVLQTVGQAERRRDEAAFLRHAVLDDAPAVDVVPLAALHGRALLYAATLVAGVIMVCS